MYIVRCYYPTVCSLLIILDGFQEQQRSQREQWEVRQLDHDLLQQRHSEREREREQREQRELREAAEQRLLQDAEDDSSLQSVWVDVQSGK